MVRFSRFTEAGSHSISLASLEESSIILAIHVLESVALLSAPKVFHQLFDRPAGQTLAFHGGGENGI